MVGGPCYVSRFVCFYRSVLFCLYVLFAVSLVRTTHCWNSLPGTAPLSCASHKYGSRHIYCISPNIDLL